jgi:hypothetical protein
MITVTSHGSFKKTEDFLQKMSRFEPSEVVSSGARAGVQALSIATPADTGRTASCWDYELTRSGKTFSITWVNRNVVNGVNVATLIQHGHGTGTGGYVPGRDFINPAMKEVFKNVTEQVWKEVTKA